MRITYVADAQVPSRTANSIHVMRMCQAYADLGHEVTLVVPDWKSGLEPGVADVFEFYGVTGRFSIRRVPRLGGRFQTAHHAVLLPLAARWPRPALVHTRSLAAAWGLTRLLSLPTLLEAHHPLAGTRRQRTMWRDVASSARLRALVLITRALAERFALDLPDGLRPVIAPDGVDARWLAAAPKRKEARRRLGLDGTDRPVAVYTGHLYPGRGIELILELARRRPDHLFLVVGGRRRDLETFRDGPRAAGVPENARLVGFRPPSEVLLYLRAADVLLMPYAGRVETTGGSDTAAFASPMKLFEYLSAGRPILASKLPVLQEVLEHGRNALLLPYEEPERWSEALSWLARNSGEARRLAERARADARRYTWEARARGILERALPAGGAEGAGSPGAGDPL